MPSSRSVNDRPYRYFASGTGAAGLVGAFLWWELRNLGVQTGVGLSSVGWHSSYENFDSDYFDRIDDALRHSNYLLLSSPKVE